MRTATLALAVAALCSSLALASSDAVAQPAVVTGTPAAPAAPAASLPSADAIVTKVQAFYDQTASFKSEFKQTFYVKAYNVTKRSHGNVIFSKPGKMDWSYDDPAGNRVVSDGTTLHVYEAANNQVFDQPVNASQYPAGFSFLTGQGKLSASFDFEAKDGTSMGFPGGYVLVGTPKTPTAAYQKVLFYVDEQTYQIRRVLILDGQSNRNTFDFVAPSVNQPVDPNQFVFVPPPGATVVHP
jgi:outer membrane lipoprotein carrier protein